MEQRYRQAKSALEKIGRALEKAGVSRTDVIRTRLYVKVIQRDWQAVGKAHAEFFGDLRPAASMVEVKRLIDPKMLVEIEVDAVTE